MSLGKIVIASHHFTVTIESETMKRVVTHFCNPLVQHGFKKEGRKTVYGPIKNWATRDKAKKTYRFHINQWDEFKKLLSLYQVPMDKLTVEHRTGYAPFKVELPIFDHWTPRDYQVPIIDYLLQDNPVSSFIELQTGRGKSFIAMTGMSKRGERGIIILKPMYIDKWLEDMYRTYDMPKEDYMVIQGGAALLAAMELQRSGELDVKILILSNKTYQNFIKLYEEHGDEIFDHGYQCRPQELCEFFQVGFRLIDEVHQDWHMNYTFDLYTHVPKSLSLSATMLNLDEFIRRTYQIAYPNKDRYIHKELDKFVDCVAYTYTLSKPDKVRTTYPGNNNYSHNAYEEYIMRNSKMELEYMKLIKHVIDYTYIRDYKPGNRLMVFASTIEFCTRLSEYLKEQYPQFTVCRYVGEDPYEYLMDPDIRVSTLLSAGTAVDVDKLQTTVMTTNVQSIQSNVQAMGRTRPMKDGQPVNFAWLVCQDIPKHVQYHNARVEIARERCKSVGTQRYHIPI